MSTILSILLGPEYRQSFNVGPLLEREAPNIRSSRPEAFLGKYAANLHGNTHAEVQFNKIAKQ